MPHINYKSWGNISDLPLEYSCLAFDLGRSQTGVAVGNSLLKTGKMLGHIEMLKFHPKEWLEIDKIISKWQIQLIIVGEPKDTPNTAKKMYGFAKAIYRRTLIPTVLLDESYTTVSAKQDLLEFGLKKIDKTVVDSYSALLLINHWFDVYV